MIELKNYREQEDSEEDNDESGDRLEIDESVMPVHYSLSSPPINDDNYSDTSPNNNGYSAPDGNNRQSLSNQHQQSQEKGFVCDQCGHSYKSEATLTNHRSKAHGPSFGSVKESLRKKDSDNCERKGRYIVCDQCPEKFSTRHALAFHKRYGHVTSAAQKLNPRSSSATVTSSVSSSSPYDVIVANSSKPVIKKASTGRGRGRPSFASIRNMTPPSANRFASLRTASESESIGNSSPSKSKGRPGRPRKIVTPIQQPLGLELASSREKVASSREKVASAREKIASSREKDAPLPKRIEDKICKMIAAGHEDEFIKTVIESESHEDDGPDQIILSIRQIQRYRQRVKPQSASCPPNKRRRTSDLLMKKHPEFSYKTYNHSDDSGGDEEEFQENLHITNRNNRKFNNKQQAENDEDSDNVALRDIVGKFNNDKKQQSMMTSSTLKKAAKKVEKNDKGEFSDGPLLKGRSSTVTKTLAAVPAPRTALNTPATNVVFLRAVSTAARPVSFMSTTPAALPVCYMETTNRSSAAPVLMTSSSNRNVVPAWMTSSSSNRYQSCAATMTSPFQQPIRKAVAASAAAIISPPQLLIKEPMRESLQFIEVALINFKYLNLDELNDDDLPIVRDIRQKAQALLNLSTKFLEKKTNEKQNVVEQTTTVQQIPQQQQQQEVPTSTTVPGKGLKIKELSKALKAPRMSLKRRSPPNQNIRDSPPIKLESSGSTRNNNRSKRILGRTLQLQQTSIQRPSPNPPEKKSSSTSMNQLMGELRKRVDRIEKAQLEKTFKKQQQMTMAMTSSAAANQRTTSSSSTAANQRMTTTTMTSSAASANQRNQQQLQQPSSSSTKNNNGKKKSTNQTQANNAGGTTTMKPSQYAVESSIPVELQAVRQQIREREERRLNENLLKAAARKWGAQTTTMATKRILPQAVGPVTVTEREKSPTVAVPKKRGRKSAKRSPPSLTPPRKRIPPNQRGSLSKSDSLINEIDKKSTAAPKSSSKKTAAAADGFSKNSAVAGPVINGVFSLAGATTNGDQASDVGRRFSVDNGQSSAATDSGPALVRSPLKGRLTEDFAAPSSKSTGKGQIKAEMRSVSSSPQVSAAAVADQNSAAESATAPVPATASGTRKSVRTSMNAKKQYIKSLKDNAKSFQSTVEMLKASASTTNSTNTVDTAPIAASAETSQSTITNTVSATASNIQDATASASSATIAVTAPRTPPKPFLMRGAKITRSAEQHHSLPTISFDNDDDSIVYDVSIEEEPAADSTEEVA